LLQLRTKILINFADIEDVSPEKLKKVNKLHSNKNAASMQLNSKAHRKRVQHTEEKRKVLENLIFTFCR